MSYTIDNDFAKFVIRLADSEMIQGQRLSELCSKGPYLEEDIAISNAALDVIGRAEELYKIVSASEGKGISPDDYVFRRNEREYFCMKLVEQPNEDFAWTIARSYLHDVYTFEVFTQLQNSEDEALAALAKKVLIEIAYNLERNRDWMIRLGQGTEESNQRLQVAVDHMFKYIPELWDWDEIDNKYLSDTSQIKNNWEAEVTEVLQKANIQKPEEEKFYLGDYRKGVHSEFLGHILTDMQYLPRAYPDAKW